MDNQKGSKPTEDGTINVRGQRPRIDFMILADRAEVANGKLFLMGGVFDQFLVAAFPAQLTFGLALAIEVPWNATNEPIHVRVAFQTVDGGELAAIEWPLTVGRPPSLKPGDAQRIPFAIPALNLAVAQDGAYVVVATLDGIEGARIQFRVNQIGPLGPIG